MADLNAFKFVFLCGLHRSGTSPLFRILREHPQISGFRNTGVPEDEGQHVQSVYPPARAYGGPGQFGFSKEAHMTELSQLCNRETVDRLFVEWSRFWNTDREFLLEKSPPNLIRTRFLQACFPNSYFIVIVRHPIAVSLATMKFSRMRLARLFEHWRACHELFEADRASLRNVLVIRYEDLCATPSISLEIIREFLGLHSGFEAELDRTANARYFDRWGQFTASALGTTVQKDLITRFAPYFRNYGYSLSEPSMLSVSDRVSTADSVGQSA
jgi:hypothetical protein